MSDESMTEATETTDVPEPTATETESLGDAGKQALKSEREARKAAEKAAKDVQDKLDAIEAKQRDADAAKAKEQGEWEELATTREAELAEATQKLASTTDELDALRSYVTADIATAVKSLPKALVAFDPGEDAPIADRLAWLQKAKAGAAEFDTQATRGNGPNPKPGGGKIDETAALSHARRVVRPI